jgi:alkanesulfonate monooxygenase SsuD/methylene tetrahydromethanopterin reductase-like flavin-dependent oxidoreductase (luciferase family)
VILAAVAAVLLTTAFALAVIARHQASAKLNAQRKLATASDQLNAASQDLSRSSSQLATIQSSLADTQAQVGTTEDALAQVKAAEVDTIAPFMVDESTTPDEARCIVTRVVDHLGAARVLRYYNSPPSDHMPPELESAILQAESECIPGAPTA